MVCFIQFIVFIISLLISFKIISKYLGVKEGTCLVCRAPCSIMKLVPDVSITLYSLLFELKNTFSISFILQMNQEIQDYFTDPEELIKKSCEVLQFQRQHRRRLLSYLLQSVIIYFLNL